jgi:hypothetical protein
MARFRLIKKRVVTYGDNRAPGQLEMEFRTWNDRSVIVGVGAHASPGNVTNLAVYGRLLDETTGNLGSATQTKGDDSVHEIKFEAPGEPVAMTGLGLRAASGNLVGMQVHVVDIDRGISAAAATPAPPPSPAIRPGTRPGIPAFPAPPVAVGSAASAEGRDYFLGAGPMERYAQLDPGYLCTGLAMRASPSNIASAWAEWAVILRGTEQTTTGTVKALTVRANVSRVDVTVQDATGGPVDWQFDLSENLSAQMLLLAQLREAIGSGRTVTVEGVAWAADASAEVEAVTILG